MLESEINDRCIDKLKNPIAELLTAGFPGDDKETSRDNFRSYFSKEYAHVIVTCGPMTPDICVGKRFQE